MIENNMRQMDRTKQAMTGPMTQTTPASSVFRLTNTSDESIGMLGLGLLGGSPGGTSLMSRDKNSENGLDVYKS